MNRFITTWITGALLSCLTCVGSAGAQLGSVDKDLVYTPVAPCRIVDTRSAGGALVANTARNFDVTAVSSYTFQGGEAGNCNIGAIGSIAALAAVITAYNPNASGNLKAYAFSATSPPAAITMAYAAGEVRSNFAIVKLDQGAALNEMTVLSTAQTHLTIDVVGYFISPAATTPSCEGTTLSSFSIAANVSNFFNNPLCPAGYVAMTPYCFTPVSGVYSQGSGYNSNIPSAQTFCAWQNTTGSTQTVFGGNVCCRIPGR
jgi:hypothetical protein